MQGPLCDVVLKQTGWTKQPLDHAIVIFLRAAHGHAGAIAWARESTAAGYNWELRFEKRPVLVEEFMHVLELSGPGHYRVAQRKRAHMNPAYHVRGLFWSLGVADRWTQAHRFDDNLGHLVC